MSAWAQCVVFTVTDLGVLQKILPSGNGQHTLLEDIGNAGLSLVLINVGTKSGGRVHGGRVIGQEGHDVCDEGSSYGREESLRRAS